MLASLGFRTKLLKNLRKDWSNEMNKTQLVDAVAKAANLKKADAENAVNAVFESVADALKAGDKVQIIGFGNFSVKERAAREGRNPATGATIKIPASKVPAFTAGKGLKDSVNK